MTKKEYIESLYDSLEVIKQEEDVVELSLAAEKITAASILAISVAEAININLKCIQMGFEIQKEIIKMEGFDDEED